MDELKIAIAEPFKRRAKARLTPTEFTFALTLELKWLTPDESRMLIDEGLKAGLLKDEKGRIAPTFDYRSVVAPEGYKPGADIVGAIGAVRKKTLLDRIVDLIAGSGMSEAEAREMIRSRQQYLCDLVTPEVAGLIIAKEKGQDVVPLISDVFAQLIKK
jgi:hypothetical protein